MSFLSDSKQNKKTTTFRTEFISLKIAMEISLKHFEIPKIDDFSTLTKRFCQVKK